MMHPTRRSCTRSLMSSHSSLVSSHTCIYETYPLVGQWHCQWEDISHVERICLIDTRVHGAQTSPSPNFPPPGSVLKFPLRKFNVIRHPPSPKSLENVHTISMLANLCGEALGRVMCSVMFRHYPSFPLLPSPSPRRAVVGFVSGAKVALPDVCTERLGGRPVGAAGRGGGKSVGL